MGYDVRPVAISWINRTPEMGSSSFSLIKNGVGYIKVLGDLAWKTRFGARHLPRRVGATATARVAGGSRDKRGLNRSGHSFGTRAFPLVHDRHFTGSARLTLASGTRGGSGEAK